MKKILSLTILGLISLALFAEYPKYIYMCGDATSVGWSTDGTLPLYNNGDGTYEYVGDFFNGEFKMLTTLGWTPSFGPEVGSTPMALGTYKMVERLSYDDPDNKFIVTEGRYSLVFNLNDTTLVVADGVGLPDKDGRGQQPSYPECLYVVGSGCGAGWSPENAIAFTTIEDGVYQLTTTLYGHLAEEAYNEIKFLQKQSWGGIQYGAIEESEDITGVGTYSIAAFDSEKGDIHKYHNTCTQTMYYNITINLKDSTLVLEEASKQLSTLYMIGDAVGGWSFDDNAIELTGKDSVFTYSGELAAGELKFCAEKYFESETWGAALDNTRVSASGDYAIQKQNGTDHKFVIVDAAHVDLTLNIKSQVMHVTYSPHTDLKKQNVLPSSRKIMQDGQFFILKGGQRLNILGVIF